MTDHDFAAVAHQDQLEASARELALHIATYYQALLAQHLPDQLVEDLVCQLHCQLLDNASS